MVDGSGPRPRATARRARCCSRRSTSRATPKFATLRDGLAIAGERGTLATGLQGTPLAGKLRGEDRVRSAG